jgi:hypothetical protein
MSKEWDASKVPPSRFQRREGSLFSTPGSRDGHVRGADRDKAYHEKLKEKVRFLYLIQKRAAHNVNTVRAGIRPSKRNTPSIMTA